MNVKIQTGKSGMKFGKAGIKIFKADGSLKTQWQDNFMFRAIRNATGKEIKIPVLTGYPTKVKKLS